MVKGDYFPKIVDSLVTTGDIDKIFLAFGTKIQSVNGQKSAAHASYEY